MLPTSPEGLSVMAKNVMKANLFAKKRLVPPWESGDARSVDVADATSSHICGVLRVVGASVLARRNGGAVLLRKA